MEASLSGRVGVGRTDGEGVCIAGDLGRFGRDGRTLRPGWLSRPHDPVPAFLWFFGVASLASPRLSDGRRAPVLVRADNSCSRRATPWGVWLALGTGSLEGRAGVDHHGATVQVF
jgi:hypothetical protein